MSVQCLPPYTQPLYSIAKLGEAVLTCSHNLCFEPKKDENFQIFSTKHFQFSQLQKNLYTCITRACVRNVETFLIQIVLDKLRRLKVPITS